MRKKVKSLLIYFLSSPKYRYENIGSSAIPICTSLSVCQSTVGKERSPRYVIPLSSKAESLCNASHYKSNISLPTE